jgi:hypothetical protein
MACVSATLLPGIAMVPTGLLIADGSVRGTLIALEFILVIAGVLFGLFPAAAMRERASRRENRAGYTTEFRGYWSYWRLDDKTGEVLRRPGERSLIR